MSDNKNMNSENEPIISAKERLRRELILFGPPLKVIFLIATPLVFYSLLNQIFQLIDTYIAANLSAGVISTVSFVMQIEKMLIAIGSGLSIGGGVLIAKSFGSGNMKEVQRRVSTLFFLSVFIGGVLLAIVLPLMYPFLRLFKMPDELLPKGAVYTSLIVISVIFQFINTIYFSTLKSRGNTKWIMFGNMQVLVLKTSLNILIIKLVHSGIIPSENGILFLPVATIIAHFSLTCIAVSNLFSKKNPLHVRLRYCMFKKELLAPLANLSIPVFLEKFVFAFGKAIVNSMCATMGTTLIGALGVSDRICGISTNSISGFQEAEASLISNNLGNKNQGRALGFFYRTLIINMIMILVFFFLTGIFKDQIIGFFAKDNPAFAEEIGKIYYFERWDTILVAINSSVMGLLYGFGKTKISMVLNISRLFVFRIPILLIFLTNNYLRFELGISAVGMSMLISNGMTGLVAGIVAIIFIDKLKHPSPKTKSTIYLTKF